MTLRLRFVIGLLWLGFTSPALASQRDAGRRDEAAARVDAAFARWCAETAPEHPACDSRLHEPPSATRGAYRWLLLADACERDGFASYCRDFTAVRATTRPCVVAYDQRDDRWRDLDGDDPHRWAVSSPGSGPIRITGRRVAACFPIVVNTNPLVHVVERGALDIGPAPLSGALDDAAAVFADASRAIIPYLLQSASTREPGRRPGVTELLRMMPTDLDPLDALAVGTWGLSGQLVGLADLRSDVLAALNAAESSDGGRIARIEWKVASLDGEWWRTEFETLRRLRAAVAAAATPDHQGPSAAEAAKRLELAQRVLDRQLESSKTVSVLGAARERWRQFVVGTRVLSWSPIPIVDRRVPWLSEVREVFSVKPLPVFGNDVVVRRPKREGSLSIAAPETTTVSVVTGLLLTPGGNQTFDVQTSADGVRRIGASPKTGVPARLLMGVDWRVTQAVNGRSGLWPLRPLLQAGAIADTKRPGLAIGAGFDARRWLHVTVGRVWQPQTVLVGRAVGDVLANTEAIATTTALSSSWYAAVGLSLGALPPFSR